MIRMRRIFAALAVSAMLVAVLAVPATAASVSANCGSGANFVTYGTADYWQDHTHDGILVHIYYTGRAYKSVNRGYETWMEYGTVNGPGLGSPGAYCIA